MYGLVKTKRQQKNFEITWEFFCDQFGWQNDPYAENGCRYNLYLLGKCFYRRNKVIGTIEFIPYDPKNPNSTVEKRFSFSKFDEIRLYHNRIWEIDKLCIHKDYQRKGHFHDFLQILYDHALEYKPKFYVALIEKKLYRMLRISFGQRVRQSGDALVGPTTELIPTVIEISEMMNDKEYVKKVLEN
ncbi:GNAT family N-acetyltransferase [Virgibacillus necropolis]|uniref:hypothetical protein n=1 Tax=Virgibacillus necropolis TaxID=163877 RepID=UPI00384B1E95